MTKKSKNSPKIYFPLTPLLFSFAFVFAQLNAWFNEVYIQSILLPLGLTIIIAPVLFYFSRILLKNNIKAEIFSTAFLILFFSYSAIANLSWNLVFTVGNKNFGKDDFQILISVIILGVLFYKLYKTSQDLASIKLLFLRIGLAFFTITFLLMSWKQFQRMTLSPVKSPLVLPKINNSEIDKDKLPDIYFIEPEDDASPSVFKNYFNYDELEFTNFLTNNGFYIATGATSNYPKTFQSLASMLNMEYLDYLSKYKNSSDLTIVTPLINDNNVMKFLKQFGYKYYQMGSWWEPTQYNPLADDNFTIETEGRISVDSFLYNFVDSTAISPILTKLIPAEAIGDSDEDDRSRIIYQFKKLPEIVSLSGPKFVFAHIIAPHGPYVFGKNCEFVDENTTSQKSEEENYVNQTVCVNKKLETVVKTIISTSKNPPIIILVTDEGVPFLNEKLTPTDNWKTASQDLLKEKFPILSAFFLPGVSTKMLNPNITPVNIFRTVLDIYFNAGLPQLPDKNFIFQDLGNLYQFTDVTEKIKN